MEGRKKSGKSVDSSSSRHKQSVAYVCKFETHWISSRFLSAHKLFALDLSRATTDTGVQKRISMPNLRQQLDRAMAQQYLFAQKSKD